MGIIFLATTGMLIFRAIAVYELHVSTTSTTVRMSVLRWAKSLPIPQHYIQASQQPTVAAVLDTTMEITTAYVVRITHPRILGIVRSAMVSHDISRLGDPPDPPR